MASQPPATDAKLKSERPGLVMDQTSLPPDPDRHQQQLEAIMDIAWAVSSTLEIDQLLRRIMEKVTEIMKADRSTFFIVDSRAGSLWSKVLQGNEPHEIRLRIGDGLAGWAAETGHVVNLKDAYDDPRFDRSWDEQSGYRTRSLLCVPIRDREQRIIAVIQCLNKKGRSFDLEDEVLLSCIGGQCAVAIESAFLYEKLLDRNQALQQAEAALRRANRELEILYDVEQQISDAADLEGLVDDALDRICSLLGVQAAALLLTDDVSSRIHLRSGGRGERVRSFVLSEGRARNLMVHAKLPIHRVPDPGGAMADVFAPDSLAPGLNVQETFTAPLSDGRGFIGALQLINRLESDAGEEALLRMLSLLTGSLARGIVVRREREEGQRAERLSQLGHSLGAIVHDLRTPMTAVAGFVELMATEGSEETRADYSERIGRAIAHMETMTREVLDFAKGKRDVLAQKVYMDRFISEVQEMLSPETDSFGVSLVVRSDYDGIARFDESKLKRVIFNLARNACQAMGQGGTFTWHVSRRADMLVFECSDDGPGIPAEMEGRLFDSFSTHGKEDGTGLGLAMAKKIVDAHCGSISCHSVLGAGATFRIELPF